MTGFFEWPHVTPERAAVVIDDIKQLSQPKFSYYALLLTSTLIAAIGLIANSTAVVIGAMLVSPLLTPIMGLSLSLIRGNLELLKNSIYAIILGTCLAILVSTLLGSLNIINEATPEMLARTEPNLLDLLVALFAGYAGAFAMVDPRISPALPGVAIATAIVPPIANTGLCIAMKAYEGAIGSFLLFVTNVVTVMLVTAAVFYAAGLTRDFVFKSWKSFVNRFGWAALTFLTLAIILTISLVDSIRDRKRDYLLNQVIGEKISNIRAAQLTKTVYEFENGTLYILADARAPEVINPDQVLTIQNALEKELVYPVELIVRTTIARDMTATGATTAVVPRNLDGFFIKEKTTEKDNLLRAAWQVIYEYLNRYTSGQTKLTRVNLEQLDTGPIVIASVQSIGHPDPNAIRRIQQHLRDRVNNQSIDLVVRVTSANYWDEYGPYVAGWTQYGKITPKKEKIADPLEKAIRKLFQAPPDDHPTYIHFRIQHGRWRALVEVAGTQTIDPKTVKEFETKLTNQFNMPISLYVWFRPETVVTDTGYMPFEDLIRQSLNRSEKERPLPVINHNND